MQSVGHGIVFPRIAGDRYSPGFLASFFLHVPIGVTYLRAIHSAAGLTRGDFLKAVPYTVVFALIGVAGPNVIGKNRDAPHSFTEAQTGPHGVGPTAVNPAS